MIRKFIAMMVLAASFALAAVPAHAGGKHALLIGNSSYQQVGSGEQWSSLPATEASGRIHTSAATVAVLPEAEEIDVQVRDEDIRIDTMRAAGAGGQHVNKTDSAVRITHLPTGIIVVSAEKSQHQNRRLAMQVLRSRLYEMERSRSADARASERKSQVGTGERNERIRTYNFPQSRMTDHRIDLTLYNLPHVIEGDLDPVIDPLLADSIATRLAALETKD